MKPSKTLIERVRQHTRRPMTDAQMSLLCLAIGVIYFRWARESLVFYAMAVIFTVVGSLLGVYAIWRAGRPAPRKP